MSTLCSLWIISEKARMCNDMGMASLIRLGLALVPKHPSVAARDCAAKHSHQ